MLSAWGERCTLALWSCYACIVETTGSKPDATMIDLEQIAQEDALFPWLPSDCMADECQEPDFFDPDEDCDED